MIPWRLAAALGALGAPLGAMTATAVACWTRTRPVRRGLAEGAAPSQMDRGTASTGLRSSPSRSVSTSELTRVPAVGGVLLAATGLAMAIADALSPGRGPSAPAVTLAASGAIIAWAGWSARVIRLTVGPQGFSIAYRRRPSFVTSWERLTRLTPPRWPLGGWRLTAGSDSREAHRTLMASDVLGNEWVLAATVENAGLRFDGRGWTRTPSRSRRSLLGPGAGSPR